MKNNTTKSQEIMEFDIEPIVSYIKRHILIILLFTLAGVIASVILYKQTPKQYEVITIVTFRGEDYMKNETQQDPNLMTPFSALELCQANKDKIESAQDIELSLTTGKTDPIVRIRTITSEPAKTIDELTKFPDTLNNTAYIKDLLKKYKEFTEAELDFYTDYQKKLLKEVNKSPDKDSILYQFSKLELEQLLVRISAKIPMLRHTLSTLRGFEFLVPPYIANDGNPVGPSISLYLAIGTFTGAFIGGFMPIVISGVKRLKHARSHRS